MTRLRFSEMTHADIPAVQSFLIKHLNLFFNAGRVMPAAEEDIFDLRQQYILQERNLLLCAWSEKQELIATLAVCQYDDRITELRGHYNLPETAEICRCYVDARYRRQGIGSRLFALAQMFCQQQKYKPYIFILIISCLEGIIFGCVKILASLWICRMNGNWYICRDHIIKLTQR